MLNLLWSLSSNEIELTRLWTQRFRGDSLENANDANRNDQQQQQDWVKMSFADLKHAHHAFFWCYFFSNGQTFDDGEWKSVQNATMTPLVNETKTFLEWLSSGGILVHYKTKDFCHKQKGTTVQFFVTEFFGQIFSFLLFVCFESFSLAIFFSGLKFLRSKQLLYFTLFFFISFFYISGSGN